MAERKIIAEEIFTEILKTRDTEKAWQLAMQSAMTFYHLIGKDKFENEEEFLKAFPFSNNILDDSEVFAGMLKTFEIKKNVW